MIDCREKNEPLVTASQVFLPRYWLSRRRAMTANSACAVARDTPGANLPSNHNHDVALRNGSKPRFSSGIAVYGIHTAVIPFWGAAESAGATPITVNG